MDSNTTGGSYTPPPPPSGGGPMTPPPAGGGDLIYPPTPPKEPVLILLLNLILAGVGYFLIGQNTKGIVAIIAALVIGVPTCGIGWGVLCIVTGLDGYFQSEAQKAGHPLGQWTFFKDHR